jgi:hypothetical protein
MVEQRSKRTEHAGVPRVEYLLGVLRGLSQQDPPPALRGRLERLSAKRLTGGAEFAKRIPRAQWAHLSWLRPVLVVALLVAIGIAAMFVARVRQPGRLRAGIESRVAPLGSHSAAVLAPLPAAPSRDARLPERRHSLPKLAQNTIVRRMIVRLPYSNSAIDTGTDATIQVSISQAELVSLGFPMNETLHDRRVVAELTLGDDGLPRAISVPLPLELVREKK